MHQVVKMVSFVFIISTTRTIGQNLMEIWRSWIEFFVVLVCILFWNECLRTKE